MAEETAQTQTTEEQPANNSQGEIEGGSEETGTSLFSPEGFFMISVAGILDIIGIALFCFGLDDFGVTDAIAYATIGIWLLVRGGGASQKKSDAIRQTEEALKKAQKLAGRMKWVRGAAFIGELIPYVGALPMWTVMVYLELKQ